jgi:hypothetical protein
VKNKLFTFYWNNGVKRVLKGLSPLNALAQANISRDYAPLSFYEEGECMNYVWIESSKKWASCNGFQNICQT